MSSKPGKIFVPSLIKRGDSGERSPISFYNQNWVINEIALLFDIINFQHFNRTIIRNLITPQISDTI